MKRKDFDTAKSSIRYALRMLDRSFVPNHVYDEDSLQVKYVADILYIASRLHDALIEH